MKTTVTLDPDLVAALQPPTEIHGWSLEQAVNEALRTGLTQMLPRPRYGKRASDLGRPPLGNVDNAGEVQAVIDGE